MNCLIRCFITNFGTKGLIKLWKRKTKTLFCFLGFFSVTKLHWDIYKGQAFYSTYHLLVLAPLMEDTETLNLSHKNLLTMPVIDVNIKNVILYRNKIDKITTLPSNIEYLDISDNVIERIENLENLNSLKVLDMSFNLLESTENLEHLVNLEELYLHANEIKKIENLDSLKNLKKLDLSSNDITKIENFMDLTSLQELYIANNEITEIPDLSFLCNLKVLGMQNNLLKSLDCHNLPNGLETLLLNENSELDTIKNFDHLTSLSYVEFIKTKVKNIDTKSKITIVYKQNGINE